MVHLACGIVSASHVGFCLVRKHLKQVDQCLDFALFLHLASIKVTTLKYLTNQKQNIGAGREEVKRRDHVNTETEIC